MILNLTNKVEVPGAESLPTQQFKSVEEIYALALSADKEELVKLAQSLADLSAFNGLGGDEDDDPAFLKAVIGGSGVNQDFLELVENELQKSHGMKAIRLENF